MPIENFHTVTLQTVNAITFDKIVMVLRGDRVRVFFNEWDDAFADAFKYYELDKRLPEDWDTLIETVGSYTFTVADDRNREQARPPR